MKKMRIDEVCLVNPRQGVNLPENSKISFVPMAAVSVNGQVDSCDTLELKKAKNYTVFQNGDVLFAKITPCMENGKGAIVRNLLNGYGAGSTEFIVLRPKENVITAKWLYLYLSQRSFRWECQQHMTGSAGQKRVPPKYLASCEMPVPSIEEQERIVSKIEELFSRLDASVAELKTAKEKLKVYRQAVLKEAFDKASSSNSKEMTIDSLLTKTRKGMSTGPFGTMLKKFEHQRAGVPVLGIENIGEGKFVPGNKIFVTPEKATELQAFRVHTGDIIISRSGTVGELCIVPPYMENSLLSTNLMRISLDFEIVLPTYFVYLFRSKGVVVDQVKELCKGSTRMFLNQTILKQIRFPIPSIPAQQKLVNMVESRLSICDNIEQTIDTSLQQAEAMRQSILKQAFEGRLL